MTGKTHAAVGLGTVLAVTQPSTVSGLVLAAGTGMLGALISDIDVGTSKSHKDADRITLIAVLLVAAEIALNYFYDFSIWEKIRNNQSMAPVAMGVIIFIAVCAFGKNQPHRSFMHSIMAMAILSAAISMVSVKLVLILWLDLHHIWCWTALTGNGYGSCIRCRAALRWISVRQEALWIPCFLSLDL